MPRITCEELDLYFCAFHEGTEVGVDYPPVLHVFDCVEARNDFATDPLNFDARLGDHATILFPDDVERGVYDEIVIHLSA